MKRYETSFVIGDTVPEVWDFLTQFAVFGKFKVVGQEPEKHLLKINAPVNFNTMGENIEVWLEPKGSEATTLFIRSSSKLRTAIMDMGKNKRNVMKVQEFITSKLEEAVANPAEPAAIEAPSEETKAE